MCKLYEHAHLILNLEKVLLSQCVQSFILYGFSRIMSWMHYIFPFPVELVVNSSSFICGFSFKNVGRTSLSPSFGICKWNSVACLVSLVFYFPLCVVLKRGEDGVGGQGKGRC